MSKSTAVLKYGTYQFDPVPQIGMRWNHKRTGTNQTGPAQTELGITLVANLRGLSRNAIETKMAALRAALAKDRQTLYWHDGTTLRLNLEAHILSYDLPQEWGQFRQAFTITLVCHPRDDTRSAQITCSYGGFTFATSGTNSILPSMGREFSTERANVDADRGVTRVKVNLVGWFEEGTIDANVSKLETLKTALLTDGSLLTYGNWSQTCNVESWSHAPDIMAPRVAYSITFSYTLGTISPYTGVTKMQSVRRISRVCQRLAKHLRPFVNGGFAQQTGKTPQTVQASGYIVADTLAHAQAAALTEFEAQFPADGLEEPGSEVTENADEKKVEWNITKWYATAALTGGIYGS